MLPMPRSVFALRHVAFEDLGVFAEVFSDRGFTIRYLDAPFGLSPLDASDDDLVVILGGPIGAYEETAYPFLADEITLIRARLDRGLPMLGLCLGAQLIAHAAGGRVYPGPVKEIGFGEVSVENDGVLQDLAGVAVLHWHGDTFDLPNGATALASTATYANQAFALENTLALQFHPEIDPQLIEPWLVGHASELASAGIDPGRLRTEAARQGPRLVQAGQAMLRRYLDGLP